MNATREILPMMSESALRPSRLGPLAVILLLMVCAAWCFHHIGTTLPTGEEVDASVRAILSMKGGGLGH